MLFFGAVLQPLARFLTLLFRETYKLGPHRLTSSVFFRYYEPQWFQIAKTRHKISFIDVISRVFPSEFQQIYIYFRSGGFRLPLKICQIVTGLSISRFFFILFLAGFWSLAQLCERPTDEQRFAQCTLVHSIGSSSVHCQCTTRQPQYGVHCTVQITVHTVREYSGSRHCGSKWPKPAKNKFTWCDFTNFSK